METDRQRDRGEWRAGSVSLSREGFHCSSVPAHSKRCRFHRSVTGAHEESADVLPQDWQWRWAEKSQAFLRICWVKHLSLSHMLIYLILCVCVCVCGLHCLNSRLCSFTPEKFFDKETFIPLYNSKGMLAVGGASSDSAHTWRWTRATQQMQMEPVINCDWQKSCFGQS